MKSFIVLILISITFVCCHPDPRLKLKNSGECIPIDGSEETFKYAFPVSWHVHVVYMSYQKPHLEKAIALHKKFMTTFKDFLGEDCSSLSDDGRLCYINDHNISDTNDGPFPVGDWAIFVPNSHLNLVISWFAQNRGILSVLFHPNTGCAYEDHTAWAMWVGQPWPLYSDMWIPGKKTSEKDHTAGDVDNPTCMKKNQNCGHIGFKGPGLACCEGTTCACNDGVNCKCIDLNEHVCGKKNLSKEFLKFLKED